MMVFLAVFAGLLAAAVGSCHLAFPSYTHRYRLTLEAEADGEVRRGSSVVQVTWQRLPQILDSDAWRAEVRGEAALVELGRHGVLLAALSGNPTVAPLAHAQVLAFRAFGIAEGAPGKEPFAALRRSAGHYRALAPEAMPRLVWLPDPGDPAAARPVRPAQTPFEVAPGVRLLGATLEITTDPVTAGIARRLPWLPEMWRKEQTTGTSSRTGQFVLHATSLYSGRN